MALQTALGGSINLFRDSVKVNFAEIESAAEANKDLWNTNLYAPLLLVDPSTRKVLANFPDTSHILRKEGEIYTGILPDDVNIANTALEWGGVKWAMVMLPLPESKEERLNLFLHELFHAFQPELGFIAYNPGNNHLDKKEGRVYLRLELEALKKALTADSNSEVKRHLVNAFGFRKFRRARCT
ncbi:MAG TPA: hypothetical protein VHP30_03090 [Ignavibacteriales bacterium]|nr:hypothetical protein [Ignavibacteriales bacterium]